MIPAGRPMADDAPRILLIDDDDLVRGSLKLHLESRGYDVTLACNGREGLAAFQRAAFDIVVTDILMPEMEGIETILNLRRAAVTVPIIAISGGSHGLDVDTYLRMSAALGATATLRKPFAIRDFMAVLDDCIAPQHRGDGASGA